MVEAVFATIADIDYLDDFCGKAKIEHVALTELGLEIGTTGKDQASDVDLVVGDEVLNSMFSHLANVVVSLFVTQTRETEGRLSTTSVLLGQVDGEFVDNFASVSGECAEECAVTIHHDEAEFRIRLEQLRQCLCVELVVAKIQGPAPKIRNENWDGCV